MFEFAKKVVFGRLTVIEIGIRIKFAFEQIQRIPFKSK